MVQLSVGAREPAEHQLRLGAVLAPLREVATLDGHPDAGLAVPASDHFPPLLHGAGMAGATGTTAELLVDGFTDGSLSMVSHTVGVAPRPDDAAAGSRA